MCHDKIDLNKKYQTLCGWPVRNLHWDMFSITGEYFFNGEWRLGAWLGNGAPDVFPAAGNRGVSASLGLIEVPESKISKQYKPVQMSLMLEEE